MGIHLDSREMLRIIIASEANVVVRQIVIWIRVRDVPKILHPDSDVFLVVCPVGDAPLYVQVFCWIWVEADVNPAVECRRLFSAINERRVDRLLGISEEGQPVVLADVQIKPCVHRLFVHEEQHVYYTPPDVFDQVD